MNNIAKTISRFTKKEIDILFTTSKAILKSKELVILTAPCLLSSGRILLITSRKVGNAPQRNLLRRWGRAIFYEQRLFEKQIHCIVIFKAPAKYMTFDHFKKILIQSLEKSIISDKTSDDHVQKN